MLLVITLTQTLTYLSFLLRWIWILIFSVIVRVYFSCRCLKRFSSFSVFLHNSLVVFANFFYIKAYREWTWHHNSDCCKLSFQLSELCQLIHIFFVICLLHMFLILLHCLSHRKVSFGLHKRSFWPLNPLHTVVLLCQEGCYSSKRSNNILTRVLSLFRWNVFII